MLSYWSQIQRREQRSGQATSRSSAASSPTGSATAPASSTGCFGVSAVGRRYSGASLSSGASGISASTTPLWRMTMRPVSVSRPMTAKSSSHLVKMRSAMCSAPGRSTMSMRSWLSDSIIS